MFFPKPKKANKMEKILAGDKVSQIAPKKVEVPAPPNVDTKKNFYTPANDYYTQLDQIKSKVLFEEAIKIQDDVPDYYESVEELESPAELTRRDED